jgi:hypothetical protein
VNPQTLPELLGLDPLSWAVGLIMGIFCGIVLLHSAIKNGTRRKGKNESV